jgi:hypothetical protein
MSAAPEQHSARCACGALSLTVASPPFLHGICHCVNCKQRTGSAFGISMYFRRGDLVSIDGESRIYEFHHPAQNHDQQRHFCARCGTTLFWYQSTRPDWIGVAGGCFGDLPFGAPNVSVTHGKRFDWVGLPDGWQLHLD